MAPNPDGTLTHNEWIALVDTTINDLSSLRDSMTATVQQLKSSLSEIEAGMLTVREKAETVESLLDSTSKVLADAEGFKAVLIAQKELLE